MTLIRLSILCLGLATAAIGHAQNIFTVAGGARAVGDGGPALKASIFGPSSIPTGTVAVDNTGNLFIAEAGYHRVRRVDAATGIVTTIAGTGTAGFSGDGAPATAAALNQPTGIATDAAGNLFIADSQNRRIRKVDRATGTIATFAGGAPNGGIEDGIPATNAQLTWPTGVAVDAAGNVLISDTDGNRIRKVNAATGMISTVASSLAHPTSIAVDATGNVYFVGNPAGNIVVYKIGAGTQVATPVAGGGSGPDADGGPATSVRLSIVNGLAISDAGHLLFSMGTSPFLNVPSRLRQVHATTGVLSTVVGDGTAGFTGDGGPAALARVSNPAGMAVDAAGNLFIADSGNQRVRRVLASTGVINTVAGAGPEARFGDGGLATLGQVYPSAIATDASGNLFIAEFAVSGAGGATFSNRIRRLDAVTGVTTAIVGGDNIEAAGSFGGDGGPAFAARLNRPSGVGLDSAGNLFISDTGNHRIRKVDAATGVITTVAGDGTSGFQGDGGAATSARLSQPRAIAVDASGSVFFIDSGNRRVRKLTVATGVISTVAGDGTDTAGGDDGPATSAGLGGATGVAVDGTGNLLISQVDPGAPSQSTRVRKVDVATGTISTLFSAGTPLDVRRFEDVSVDAQGNVFVTEYWRSCVLRREAATQAVSAVVSNCAMGPGHAGDGGPASLGQLSLPKGIAADAGGNLYIVESGYNLIRKVTNQAAFALSVAKSGAGSGSVVSAHAASPSIDCGATCSANYLSGTPMTLVAQPAGDSVFSGWSGACSGSGLCSVTMDQARSVTATFDPRPGFALTATKVALTGTDTGTVTFTAPGTSALNCVLASCANYYAASTVATLTATASAGTKFMGWDGTCTGAGSCQVTMDAAKSVTANFAIANPPRLVNISTRGHSLSGNDVMIGGFVLGGTSPKTVAIVVTGPSLGQYGIANPLGNPKVTVFRADTGISVGQNDNWVDAPNFAAIQASGFAPPNPLEPAFLATLGPGSYTAVVEGVGGATGIAVIAVYEIDGKELVPLANISTRGRVGTGNDVLIGGFVIDGNGPQTVAIVGTGPSLSQYGIPNPLANPTITLVRQGTPAQQLAVNDDWQQASNMSQIQSSGFAPSDPKESAILITLQPGAYTAILSGVGGGTGVGVIGVYKVP
jgi:sugar lactone lactonase YvrE